MSTTRRRVATGTVLAAALLTTPAVAQASGHSRPAPRAAAGFSTVHSESFAAQALTSPAPGSVVVGGVAKAASGAEGSVVVDQLAGGRWTKHTLAATATRVSLASANGTTWLLADGATPTLWSGKGTTWTKVALPALPAGTTQASYVTVAAEGSSVLLWGSSWSDKDGAQATRALRTGSSWAVARQAIGGGTSMSGPATMNDLATLSHGHAVVNSGNNGAWYSDEAFDMTATPATHLGRTRQTAPAGGGWETSDWVVRSAGDITLWGDAARTTDQTMVVYATSGSCKHLVNGTTTTCPAPAWAVKASVALADGRTVIGGADTNALRNNQTNQVLQVVQGGYALVAKDGANPAPLAGDPGTSVVDLAAETQGTTVWSLVKDGTTMRVQRMTVPVAQVARHR